MGERASRAGEQAIAAAGSPTLDAIGLANQGETVLAWDRATGAPHGRGDRVAGPPLGRRVRPARRRTPTSSPHLTGLELDPYFVAPKIAWLRERVDAALAITTTDTWMLHRLCGAFVTDVATAGRSLLLDLDTGAWSERGVRRCSASTRRRCPTVVGNAEPLGDARRCSAAAVPVTGACVDQQAALFAEACHARRRGEVHLRHRRVPAGVHRRSRRRASANGLVGCPAWRLGDDAHLVPRRSGVHGRRGGELADRHRA